MKPKTLFEKIWDAHVVDQEPGKPVLLYVDLHLVHEVTSPQAFEGLRLSGRRVRRPDFTIATVDHNVPTSDRRLPIADPISRQQIETMRRNAEEFGVTYYGVESDRQGIVQLANGRPLSEIVAGLIHAVDPDSVLHPRAC